MSEIQDLSPEEINRRAWKFWRDMDFSWEGLAKPSYVEVESREGSPDVPPDQIDLKNPIGYRQTLQDYWRTDPATAQKRTDAQLIADGELVVHEGQKHHVMHLPEYYDEDKTVATARILRPEQINKKVEEILAARIKDLRRTDIAKRSFQNLWLSGCIIPKLEMSFDDQEIPISIMCHDTMFLSPLVLRRFGALLDVEFKRISFINSPKIQKLNISSCEFDDCIFVDEFHVRDIDVNSLSISNSFFYSNFSLMNMQSDIFSLEGITFKKSAKFIVIKQKLATSFCRCEFRDDLSLTRCGLGLADFRNLAFLGDVEFPYSNIESLIFRNISWPVDRIVEGVFEYSTVENLADFTNTDMRYAAFDGANFKGGIRFDRKSESSFESEFVKELQRIPSFSKGGESRGDFKDRKFARVEAGCRNLKQAMTNMADKSMEQIFYRFELIARRRQSKTPATEKIISYTYEYLAKCGASYVQPVRMLLAVCLVFAVAYWPLSETEGTVTWPYAEKIFIPAPPSLNIQGLITEKAKQLTHEPSLPTMKGNRLGEVLSVSASRIFPFGAFANESEDFADNAKKRGALYGYIYETLATVESFFALALAFMFALSVKRRFQIS